MKRNIPLASILQKQARKQWKYLECSMP